MKQTIVYRNVFCYNNLAIDCINPWSMDVVMEEMEGDYGHFLQSVPQQKSCRRKDAVPQDSAAVENEELWVL